jgi:hypothetical protein
MSAKKSTFRSGLFRQSEQVERLAFVTLEMTCADMYEK